MQRHASWCIPVASECTDGMPSILIVLARLNTRGWHADEPCRLAHRLGVGNASSTYTYTGGRELTVFEANAAFALAYLSNLTQPDAITKIEYV